MIRAALVAIHAGGSSPDLETQADSLWPAKPRLVDTAQFHGAGGVMDWRRCVARSDLAAALATAVCLVMTAGCNAAPTGPLGRTGGPGSAAPLAAAVSAVRTVISANHGHTVVLTVDQLLSHAAMQVDIQGDADHSHTLDLSAEDVIDLDSGAGLVTTSSISAGHDHVVTFLGYWDY